MKEVEPRFKDAGECPCGCGAYGPFRVKTWSDGKRHTRNCDKKKCNHCRGGANKRKGARKQALAVSMLGMPRSSLHPGHEEFLGGQIRVEIKNELVLYRPVKRAYRLCEEQSEAQRPHGDVRPFAAVFMPDGEKDGLLVVRLSNLHEFVSGMVEQWGAA